jgi:bacteriocin-type transport-associated protein
VVKPPKISTIKEDKIMTDILLEELSNSDIQWLKEIGQLQRVNPDAVLIAQQTTANFLYIVMEGNFIATLTRHEGGRLGRAFAALEDNQSLEQEIGQFSSGEVLGEMTFLDVTPAANTIKATEESVVLAIPSEELLEKLSQDFGFASRFYRAIAMLLLERFQSLVKLYLKRRLGQIAPLQDVPLIFGELNDSDVDWMLQKGHLENIASDTILISSGEQVENLYILLQGLVSVFVSESKKNRLSSVFVALETDDQESSASLGREIGQISKGEILGEIAALDSHRSYSTIKTLEDCSVLVIPRQQLLLKLQQDPAMAGRFYRVVAKLLSGRLQGLISRLGFGKSSYQVGERLTPDLQYEDELDLDVMDNLSLGGARFDWMLRRLKVS